MAVQVGPGALPLYVGDGAGIIYQSLFCNYWYQNLLDSHKFGTLTEATKPGTSPYRSGLYITRVNEDAATGERTFKLLRCSTSFTNPTENLRPADEYILEVLNKMAAVNFHDSAPLDHVLAQQYVNVISEDGKARRGTIADHSDKTKDMAPNGIMAFVTFYSRDIGSLSECTSLVWTKKAGAPEELPKTWQAILFTGSVLFVPLSTNRWYTHRIVAGSRPVHELPTRIGYVARCSKTTAVSTLTDGTFLVVPSDEGEGEGGVGGGSGSGERRVPLVLPSADDIDRIRKLYKRENMETSVVDYGPVVPFSLNAGDYLRPEL